MLMVQERHPKKSSETDENQQTADATDAAVAAAGEHKQELDDDIDAILGEIDDVLEVNAEDFVKAFIQKGGQ